MKLNFIYFVMSYFTKDFLAFFKELSTNNHKEWFHDNKKRYESSVKNPFTAFLNDLFDEIKKYDKEFNTEPKNCIARINRDIRFAKDKTPYNTHYTAFASRGGKKNKDIPGIFLRFSPEETAIMGGCYMPPKEQLQAIRKMISANIPQFRKLIEDKDFVAKFGGIVGDEHKRIPVAFQEAYRKEPLIAKKQFYYVAQRAPELILRKDLLAEIMSYWHTARPINDYLTKAIQNGI